MNVLKTTYVLGVILGITTNLSAQSKYSNDFLTIGVGARELSMGLAVASTTKDVYAGYWNPAGLVRQKDNYQAALMHANYFNGIANYDYAGISAKIDDKSAIGLSMIRLGVDDIFDTSELIDANGQVDYNRIKKFSTTDNAFIVSYSRKLKPNLSIGVNTKIIYRKVGAFASAWGFGIDAGVQYSVKKWQLGANLRDMTSTFNVWNFNTQRLAAVFQATNNEIPTNSTELTLPNLQAGASYATNLGKEWQATVGVELITYFDGKRNTLLKSNFASADPRIGMEFSYQDKVFLRTGVHNFQTFVTDFDGKKRLTVQPTIGAGFRLKAFCIDYAFTNFGNANTALSTHTVSLKLGINQLGTKNNATTTSN